VSITTGISLVNGFVLMFHYLKPTVLFDKRNAQWYKGHPRNFAEEVYAMAAIVRRIEYYSTVVPNRAGAGAKVFNALKAGGVNLVAYNGFPMSSRHAQLAFVPSERDAFLAAAQKAGIKLVGPKAAFLIQGEDRVGAVADVLSKLGEAKVNVTAMQAIATGAGRYGAILWVKPRNISKTAQALGVS
jgi:hypothetical protein